MLRLFRYMREAMRFAAQPPSQRRLTFYSEGRNYWPHLGGLVRYVLDHSDIPVGFITSDPEDPVFALDHPRLNVFLTDQGGVRNYLFANIDTDLFVMTMPDIDRYQVKRSRHPVHYLYVQHALVSLHMVYRPGAFDHYDTIFCGGPHHVEEMRAIEAAHGLEPKTLVKHGYAWLDSIAEQGALRPQGSEDRGSKHVLVAPSWGPDGVIESGVGARLVDLLLKRGHRVTLRPHPETLKHAKGAVDAVVSKHSANPDFTFEANVSGQSSLHSSDVLVTAWSGMAFDYAFGLGKPVVFIDVPKKINNPDYAAIPCVPVEIAMREKIGQVLAPDALDTLDISALAPPSRDDIDSYVFNLGNSNAVGGQWIIDWVRANGRVGA